MDGTCVGVLVGIMGDKGFDVGGGSGVLLAVGKGAGAQPARPIKSMESTIENVCCLFNNTDNCFIGGTGNE
jgi:hypothetical protein